MSNGARERFFFLRTHFKVLAKETGELKKTVVTLVLTRIVGISDAQITLLATLLQSTNTFVDEKEEN